MHLCAELTADSWMMEPIGEAGASFSLQLSSRTQFARIKNKKNIADFQINVKTKKSMYFSLWSVIVTFLVISIQWMCSEE